MWLGLRVRSLIWIYFLLFPFLPVYADAVFRVIVSGGLPNLLAEIIHEHRRYTTYSWDAVNNYLLQLSPYEGFVRVLLAFFLLGLLYAVYERKGRATYCEEVASRTGVIGWAGLAATIGYLVTMLIISVAGASFGRNLSTGSSISVAIQVLVLPCFLAHVSLAAFAEKIAVLNPNLGIWSWDVITFILTLFLGGLTLHLGSRLGANLTKIRVLKASLPSPPSTTISLQGKPRKEETETAQTPPTNQPLSFTAPTSLKKAGKAVEELEEPETSKEKKPKTSKGKGSEEWEPAIGEKLVVWLEPDENGYGKPLLQNGVKWKLRFSKGQRPKLKPGWRERWEVKVVHKNPHKKKFYVELVKKVDEEPITRPRQPGEDIEDYLERTDRRLEPWEEDVYRRKRPRMEV